MTAKDYLVMVAQATANNEGAETQLNTCWTMAVSLESNMQAVVASVEIGYGWEAQNANIMRALVAWMVANGAMATSVVSAAKQSALNEALNAAFAEFHLFHTAQTNERNRALKLVRHVYTTDDGVRRDIEI